MTCWRLWILVTLLVQIWNLGGRSLPSKYKIKGVGLLVWWLLLFLQHDLLHFWCISAFLLDMVGELTWDKILSVCLLKNLIARQLVITKYLLFSCIAYYHMFLQCWLSILQSFCHYSPFGVVLCGVHKNLNLCYWSIDPQSTVIELVPSALAPGTNIFAHWKGMRKIHEPDLKWQGLDGWTEAKNELKGAMH